ncbi:MAG TPA: response regulator [Azospirillaceae bacterium]|nr:response regulator [Azospirillaceae bacterium]
MTTVLVVDDSRLARDMVTSALTSLFSDWTIVTAVGADDALAKVEAQRPDVAIIDYNMPGTDGLTLAVKLREKFHQIPIGILTANVQDSLRRKAEALGCAFIAKPVTGEKLRAFLTKSPE